MKKLAYKKHKQNTNSGFRSLSKKLAKSSAIIFTTFTILVSSISPAVSFEGKRKDLNISNGLISTGGSLAEVYKRKKPDNNIAMRREQSKEEITKEKVVTLLEEIFNIKTYDEMASFLQENYGITIAILSDQGIISEVYNKLTGKRYKKGMSWEKYSGDIRSATQTSPKLKAIPKRTKPRKTLRHERPRARKTAKEQKEIENLKTKWGNTFSSLLSNLSEKEKEKFLKLIYNLLNTYKFYGIKPKSKKVEDIAEALAKIEYENISQTISTAELPKNPKAAAFLNSLQDFHFYNTYKKFSKASKAFEKGESVDLSNMTIEEFNIIRSFEWSLSYVQRTQLGTLMLMFDNVNDFKKFIKKYSNKDLKELSENIEKMRDSFSKLFLTTDSSETYSLIHDPDKGILSLLDKCGNMLEDKEYRFLVINYLSNIYLSQNYTLSSFITFSDKMKRKDIKDKIKSFLNYLHKIRSADLNSSDGYLSALNNFIGEDKKPGTLVNFFGDRRKALLFFALAVKPYDPASEIAFIQQVYSEKDPVKRKKMLQDRLRGSEELLYEKGISPEREEDLQIILTNVSLSTKALILSSFERLHESGASRNTLNQFVETLWLIYQASPDLIDSYIVNVQDPIIKHAEDDRAMRDAIIAFRNLFKNTFVPDENNPKLNPPAVRTALAVFSIISSRMERIEGMLNRYVLAGEVAKEDVFTDEMRNLRFEVNHIPGMYFPMERLPITAYGYWGIPQIFAGRPYRQARVTGGRGLRETPVINMTWTAESVWNTLESYLHPTRMVRNLPKRGIRRRFRGYSLVPAISSAFSNAPRMYKKFEIDYLEEASAFGSGKGEKTTEKEGETTTVRESASFGGHIALDWRLVGGGEMYGAGWAGYELESSETTTEEGGITSKSGETYKRSGVKGVLGAENFRLWGWNLEYSRAYGEFFDEMEESFSSLETEHELASLRPPSYTGRAPTTKKYKEKVTTETVAPEIKKWLVDVRTSAVESGQIGENDSLIVVARVGGAYPEAYTKTTRESELLGLTSEEKKEGEVSEIGEGMGSRVAVYWVRPNGTVQELHVNERLRNYIETKSWQALRVNEEEWNYGYTSLAWKRAGSMAEEAEMQGAAGAYGQAGNYIPMAAFIFRVAGEVSKENLPYAYDIFGGREAGWEFGTAMVPLNLSAKHFVGIAVTGLKKDKKEAKYGGRFFYYYRDKDTYGRAWVGVWNPDKQPFHKAIYAGGSLYHRFSEDKQLLIKLSTGSFDERFEATVDNLNELTASVERFVEVTYGQQISKETKWYLTMYYLRTAIKNIFQDAQGANKEEIERTVNNLHLLGMLQVAKDWNIALQVDVGSINELNSLLSDLNNYERTSATFNSTKQRIIDLVKSDRIPRDVIFMLGKEGTFRIVSRSYWEKIKDEERFRLEEVEGVVSLSSGYFVGGRTKYEVIEYNTRNGKLKEDKVLTLSIFGGKEGVFRVDVELGENLAKEEIAELAGSLIWKVYNKGIIFASGGWRELSSSTFKGGEIGISFKIGDTTWVVAGTYGQEEPSNILSEEEARQRHYKIFSAPLAFSLRGNKITLHIDLEPLATKRAGEEWRYGILGTGALTWPLEKGELTAGITGGFNYPSGYARRPGINLGLYGGMGPTYLPPGEEYVNWMIMGFLSLKW